MRHPCFVAILISSMVVPITAQVPAKNASRVLSVQKTLGDPRYAVLNINNLSTWMRYDGQSNHSPGADNGLYFPRRTAAIIYQDGIVWGGKAYTNAALSSPEVNGQGIRVGGGTYSVGTQAGRVLGRGSSAVAEDPMATDVRLYRIRRDYATMTDEELRRDAADVYERANQNDVTFGDMNAVRNQYAVDWSSWPVSRGAPFIDRNGNGVYDPPPMFNIDPGSGPLFTAESLRAGAYDEPGYGTPEAPADQVMWTVFNDLSPTKSVQFVGSLPLGLEVQKTVWGYKRTDALGNVYFARYRIVNVGGVDTSNSNGDQLGSFWIDSLYVAQWSDPDLGSFSDDLVGCDTTVNLGYAYNGSPVDARFSEFGLPPPAVGYDIVGGAVVPSPGDSAVWDRRRIHDMRNLSMTSFVYFGSGDSFSDPPGGVGNYSTGSSRWWKLLRGYIPQGDLSYVDEYYPHPPEIGPSVFTLSGDPVARTGWLDGAGQAWSFPAGDRRLIQSSGPFRMAPGDSQEIVIALAVGLGADRLSSISVMKSNSRTAQALFDGLLREFSPTIITSVDFPQPSVARLQLTSSGTSSMPESLYVEGYTNAGVEVFAVAMLDDGLHGDGAPNDGMFGAAVEVPVSPDPVRRLRTSWTNTQGQTHEVLREDAFLTLFQFPDVWPTVLSDNLNADGRANPGENVRIGVVVDTLLFDLENVVVSTVTGENDLLEVGDVGSSGGMSKPYLIDDPSTYLEITIPRDFVDTIFIVPVHITDDRANVFVMSLELPVDQLPFDPFTQADVQHIEGRASGSFAVLLVDPDSLTDHTYQIAGSNSSPEGRPLITVRDLTSDEVLLQDHELPDPTGHNMPVIDGFRIMIGTISTGQGLLPGAWTWEGEQLLTWVNGNGIYLEEFNGAVGWLTPPYYFSAIDNRVPPSQLRDVRISFAPTASDQPGSFNPVDDAQWSYAYRYLRNAASAPAQPSFSPWIVNAGAGYRFQDYRVSMPLAVFDISADPPQRLAVGFLENNTANGLVDGFYWPALSSSIPGGNNVGPNTPREWLFIYDSPYEGSSPNATFQTDMLGDTSIPVMYMATWNRLNSGAWASGNALTLRAIHPVGIDDRWTFNPGVILGVSEPEIPATFSLDQNFPNPFNPTTTIQYSLPTSGIVTLRVFNVLGQTVAELVREEQSAGRKEVVWNAGAAASGVYFCRLELGGRDGSRYVGMQKLMLVK